MPKFSINVSMMLQEYPFLDRFRIAAEAGFTGVDIQFPYDVPAAQIATAVKSAGVEVVLFNLPAGDLIQGGRGLACDPDRKQDFQNGVRQALAYVDALGNRRVNVLTGKIDSNKEVRDHLDTLIENLEYTVDVLDPLGVTVMVEPVNGFDVPDYLLQTLSSTVEVIENINSEKVKIQFDIYHRHRMKEKIEKALEKYLSLIGHIQFADSPGRHEPGTGEINFTEIFNKIDELGYADWVGAEYIPSKHTLDTLTWFHRK